MAEESERQGKEAAGESTGAEQREARGPAAEPEPGREVHSAAGSLLAGPLELARALLLGIRDTAKDVADGAREEAQAAYDERWARFEQLTKHRRERGK